MADLNKRNPAVYGGSIKTAVQTEGNSTPAQTLAERRCVTALNAMVQGIAIRAVIFQRGLGDHEYDVRIDGHPTPDSPVRGFATVEQAA